MAITGIGRVIFWTGGSLWIGQAITPIAMHSHHAIQVSIGLSGQVRLRSSDAASWNAYDLAVIPPHLPHSFQAPGETVANLFCEPASALGRGLLHRFGQGRIVDVNGNEVAKHARGLKLAFDNGSTEDELEEVALDVLYDLSGSVPLSPVDRRIQVAISFISANLAGKLSLAALARHVKLSPSRLRHLFVAETGISFRSYLLWTRLNRALDLGFGGASWTDAAHATNFADSAHLSRTARRMYGIAPSSIRPTAPSTQRPMTA
ncbi:AraC family transcriptional regulator [Mesorhizobium hawassense]|uniref:AraC family transcriptional regulator n=1 Tax=Mesorhizobium hawassense TaxID=1209954 RepID=A0A330H2T6_9HYPH|nr:AraC family transcriptional regulator [Mesorhizobium hawassense]RAZ81988.1 AraC family transcriptional regulator [Mesorhizobium hawassense]